MSSGAVAAIVQARMGSRRLPGKILRPLAGKSLLEYVLERLDHCATLAAVVVATSSDATDDAVVACCAARGVPCHRGPLDDVAARYAHVVDAMGLGAFVRISGDSPLIDQAIVDRAVTAFESREVDLVTNIFPRTFPRGQSVEVVSAESLGRARSLMTEPGDLEHVTPALYRHPTLFRIANIESGVDYGGVDLAVDTEEDLRRVEAIVGRMSRPHWDYPLDEVVALAAERVP